MLFFPMFAAPWPQDTRVLLERVSVMSSTSLAVMRDSSRPTSAMDRAYGARMLKVSQFSGTCGRKKPGRPRAFGTDLPTGAVWDGNEQQRGRAGILSFLAGGHASKALQDILHAEGVAGVIARIDWLGKPATLLRSHTVAWDHDPWARGGYAYFDPGFDPLWRAWLARPAGRIVFAGEHTSVKSQGYMNGAIESGLRAAAEISALLD